MSSNKLYLMYLRKSRADADYSDQESLARHRKRLDDLCQSMGIVCDQVIEEVGSADSIAARPGMIRLLNLVESGCYEAVICVHMDRLSRGDGADQALVINTFKYSNTKIITPQKTFDFSNDSDETYAEFDLFFSKNEYRTIKRRLVQGHIDAARQGKYPSGNAPYGYRTKKLKGEKGQTLEIIPEEAEIVRRIFDLYVNAHLGAKSITKLLNDEGCRNQRGALWRSTHITKILSDVTYTGKVRYGNKIRVKKIIAGEIIKTAINSNPDALICDGRHEAIIPGDLFQAAQDVRDKNQIPHLKQANTLENPLSGILRCKLCGRIMHMRSKDSTGKRALCCPTRGCACKGSYTADVEEAILTALGNWLADYEAAPQEAQDGREAVQILRAIKNAFKDIEAHEKKLKKVYDLFESEVYTLEEFRERSSAIREEIAVLVEAKKAKEEEYKKITAYEEARKTLIPDIISVIDLYYSLPTAKEKNLMLKKVLDVVEYEKVRYSTKKRGATFTLTVCPKIPQ